MPNNHEQTIRPERPPERLWRMRLALEARRQDAYRQRRTTESLASHVAVGLLKVLGLYKRGRRNAEAYTVQQRTVDLDRLPPQLDGFRILHLSDFHFRDQASLAPLCAVLSKIEVDLCLLTGDYGYRCGAPIDQALLCMEQVCKAFQTRHGIVGVLGNHDVGSFVDSFRAFGVRMLVNQSLTLIVNGVPLAIAGVDDPHDFRTDDLTVALAAVPQGGCTVVLAHSPELVPDAESHGADLYLCGHTHGGQIRLPWLGALSFNARCSRRYGLGRWRCGDMEGHTTAGLGATAIPVRFNCPPVADVIELRRTPAL